MARFARIAGGLLGGARESFAGKVGSKAEGRDRRGGIFPVTAARPKERRQNGRVNGPQENGDGRAGNRDETLRRVPGCDLNQEKSVLGSIILECSCFPKVAGIVHADDFYLAAHQIVFRVCKDIAAAGRPFDVELVATELVRRGELEEAGGYQYLHEILETVPHCAHAAYYAREVAVLSQRRKFGAIAENLALEARDPTKSFDELLADVRKFEEIETQRGTPEFRWYTPQELDLADVQERYLIRHVLAEAQIGTMAGSYKVLKTTLAAAASFSLATGCRFLGQFEIPAPSPVALMTAESGYAAVQSMLKRIARFHGWSLGSVDENMLSVSLDIPRADRPEHVRYIRRYINERKLKLLVIDPAIIGMGNVAEKAANVFEMSHRLMAIADIGRELGCAILFLHHFRHGMANQFTPASLGDIAFTGFAEISAQWILLSRRARFEEESGLHQLWLVTGGRSGHHGTWAVDVDEGQAEDAGGRKWEPTVRKASEARAAAVDEREAKAQQKRSSTTAKHIEQVWKAVQKYPNGETARQIRFSTGLNPERFQPALDALVAQGKVTAFKIHKNHQDRDAFKPATEHTEHTKQFRGCSAVGVCDGTPPSLRGCSGHTHTCPPREPGDESEECSEGELF